MKIVVPAHLFIGAVAILTIPSIAGSPSSNCPVTSGVECKLPKHYLEVPARSIDDCCAACNNHTGCVFWSFKASDVGSGIACRLFDGEPQVNKSSSEFISGHAAVPSPGPPSPPAKEALRLTVNGSQLLGPDGRPVRLTGSNMQCSGMHGADPQDMHQLLGSGANVVRLIFFWDNTGYPSPQSDCMTEAAPYVKASCLHHLQWAVTQITDAGMWVILTIRAKYGAGWEPTHGVFQNATLKDRMYSMWAHLAQIYKTQDRIAAYEIMSEPRDKSASPMAIKQFYAGGCSAVHAVDARTPCMVGPGHYYNQFLFTEDILIDDKNVIYTFDFLWTYKVKKYPGDYACEDLCPGWVTQCCDGKGSTVQNFDAQWLESDILRWAIALQKKAHVPVYANQVSVTAGMGILSPSNGGYNYTSDVMRIFQKYDIGWTWWQWRGHKWPPVPGSTAFMYYVSDVKHADVGLAAAVKPFLSDKDMH